MFPSDTFDLPGSDAGPEDDPPPLHSPFEDAEDAASEEGEPDAAEAAIERRRASLAESGLARKAEKGKKRGSMVWLGWLLFFLTAGGVAGGGYMARTDLVALHPPLAKLYASLGIHVEPAEWLGLELHNLKSATIIDGNETKIEVSGDVVNVGESTRPVPPIRVAMRGAGGKELAAYTLTLEDDKIAGGAKLPFNAKLPAQKEDVLDLEIAFAPLGHR